MRIGNPCLKETSIIQSRDTQPLNLDSSDILADRLCSLILSRYERLAYLTFDCFKHMGARLVHSLSFVKRAVRNQIPPFVPSMVATLARTCDIALEAAPPLNVHTMRTPSSQILFGSLKRTSSSPPLVSV